MKQQILENRIARAAELAEEGLNFEGEDHKQWYLDQILLTLLGEEEYRSNGWDQGVAPFVTLIRVDDTGEKDV